MAVCLGLGSVAAVVVRCCGSCVPEHVAAVVDQAWKCMQEVTVRNAYIKEFFGAFFWLSVPPVLLPAARLLACVADSCTAT